MAEAISVIILAGGRSSRMGRDKVWMMLDGQPLVERVARRLLPLAAEILVSAADPAPYDTLLRSLPIPGRVVADQYPGFGPLAGIQAGLNAAGSDLALVVAADMPFVSIALLQRLIGLAQGLRCRCALHSRPAQDVRRPRASACPVPALLFAGHRKAPGR